MIKEIRLLLFCVVSLLVCWCCSDDGKEDNIIPLELEISQESFRVTNAAVSVKLEITSNGDWELKRDAEWYDFSTATGSGNASVDIAIQANPGNLLRKGYIVLQGQGMEKKIILTQAALELEVDKGELSGGKGGDNFEVKVLSNGPWVVVKDSAWIHVEPAQGQDTGFFRVTLEPNPSFNRKGKIYVKSGAIARYIAIRQAGEQGGWYSDGEVRIYREEDAGNPIKLAFMGDGFIEDDLMIGGAYEQAMGEAIEAYFDVEPYKTYRNYFCPYIVYACSQERGASTLKPGGDMEVRKNTAFGVSITRGESGMKGDMDKIVRYARKIPEMNTEKAAIVVLSNDHRYAGTCFQWSNGQTVALVPMNRDLRPPGGVQHLVAHEAGGHGFGLLADEYSTNNANLPANKKGELENAHRNGMNLNVTATKDPANVFWHDFIERPGYELVDFFEGAFYYTKGVWRSEDRTCMVDNILYYSLACRLAIVKRIKSIAGEPFELDDFILKDIQKKPTPEQLTTRTLTPYRYPEPTPPVFVE